MNPAREAFLQRVRRAVAEGNRAGVLTAVPPRGQVGYQGAGPEPVACFREAFTAAGGTFHAAGDADAARNKILELVQTKSARRVLLGRGCVLDALGLEAALTGQGVEVTAVDRLSSLANRDAFFAADLGISGVDYLLAETGSIVVASKSNDPRSLSLLPPVHIAVADQSQLLPDLFDLFERLGRRGEPGGSPELPSCLTIITGPSKTGDIELKLVTGVHGPGEVHVVFCSPLAPVLGGEGRSGRLLFPPPLGIINPGRQRVVRGKSSFVSARNPLMANPQEVQKLVRDVANRVRDRKVKVAVVGDMILDTAIEGIPGAVHPDTNVPILREATAQESIGGAANIALALARLGVDVTLFGIVGSDLPGRQLENLLDRQPFADYVVTERGWPTPRKDWVYERSGNRTRLTSRIDYDRPLPGSAREELAAEFRTRCPADANVVILADHGLGGIGPESLALIGLAKERRAKVVAIPRTTILRGQPLDAIVINAAEIRRLSDANESADPRALAVRYAREYSQHVFLTLFEEGIFVCPAGSKTGGTQIEGYPTEDFQWMGARDMATALVAVGLALGLDPLDTGRVANVFRHLVACQRGNGRVMWRDVFQFVGLEASE